MCRKIKQEITFDDIWMKIILFKAMKFSQRWSSSRAYLKMDYIQSRNLQITEGLVKKYLEYFFNLLRKQ